MRVDPGIVAGATVSQFYDSLLAKITAWGPDRDTARRRLLRALNETEVEGIPTTTAFLSRVLEDDHFRNGTHWTAMVDSGVIATTGLPAPLAAPASHRRLRTGAPASRSGAHPHPEGEIRLDIPVQHGDARVATRATTADGVDDPSASAEQRPSGGVAPMDAVLVRHTVAVGDEVEATTTVAVVESMKMETHVVSGTKGVVSRHPRRRR